MGEVYLAHDPRLERSVALKVLPEALASDARRMRRFIQEAKTTSSLNHPNLLTIYEIGQEGPIHFIATEFVDGVTLREYMRTPLQLNETLRIVIQIAEALAAAHEAGVVQDRKSTRLNSSHSQISYAVFCLKKKIIENNRFVVKVFYHNAVDQPISSQNKQMSYRPCYRGYTEFAAAHTYSDIITDADNIYDT